METRAFGLVGQNEATKRELLPSKEHAAGMVLRTQGMGRVW